MVVAKSADYHDEQTHTWRLTGEAADARAARLRAGVLHLAGDVERAGKWPQDLAVARTVATREQSERWTIATR